MYRFRKKFTIIFEEMEVLKMKDAATLLKFKKEAKL